jgi:hypothetical protein
MKTASTPPPPEKPFEGEGEGGACSAALSYTLIIIRITLEIDIFRETLKKSCSYILQGIFYSMKIFNLWNPGPIFFETKKGFFIHKP